MLRGRTMLFWDFDGVIKESVDVKTRAFLKLFASFGDEQLALRVRAHHEANGGMSRFEKIPIYLEWAGQRVNVDAVERYCSEFAATVRQGVIDSPWVPGVVEYLAANSKRQHFVLLTATPQGEMDDILRAIGISDRFAEVHGAPTAKAHAIVAALSRWNCARAQALLIGDSASDHAAAERTGVDFLLRRTPLNHILQRTYSGPQCDNFLDE